MRILYLTAQPPEPPHAGGTLRTSGLLRAVHAAGNQVHILTFGSAEQLERQKGVLAAYTAAVDVVPIPRRSPLRRLRDLIFSRAADMERRVASPLFAQRLAALLAEQQFDIVQLESLEMAAFLPVVRQWQPATPIVYDAFNAEYEMQRSVYEAERGRWQRLPGALYSRIQWGRLQRFERQVCRAASHVIAVSPTDADALQRLAPGCRVSVVPNGIDTSRYAEPDSSLDLGRAAVVFTGTMGYRPNVDAALWFAEDVLPRLRRQVPAAKLFVVGSQPHARLGALRERDDVQITGWVPDIRPFLHAAAVYVAPLRMGSGTRLKLLEAMAAGRPVVSTPTGVLGLEVQDGTHLCLAHTADDFAAAVGRLLIDRNQASRLGQAGADFVRSHYDWRFIAPRLLTIYDQIRAEQSATTEDAHD